MGKGDVVNGGLKGGKYFGDEPWMYTMLGLSREDVIDMIKKEL